MDLTKLRWTKNVNHPDPYQWAYKPEEVSYPYLMPELHLHWTEDDITNAGKVPKGDLIILRQRTKVTHIVMPLDDEVYQDKNVSAHPIYRLVQVMWMTPKPEAAPDQNIVFDFDLNLQGGRVISLDTPKFNEHWNSKGGLPKFHQHVAEVLGLFRRSSNYVQL